MSKIVTAIASIIEKLEAVKKDGYRQDIKASYLTKDAVISAVSKLCGQEKVIILATADPERIFTEVYTTANGATMNYCRIYVTYNIMAEDGSSVIVGFWGEGQSTGDKAFMNAQTFTFKQMLEQLFLIKTTDEEEDSDDKRPPYTKPTYQQGKQVNNNTSRPNTPPPPPPPAPASNEDKAKRDKLISRIVELEKLRVDIQGGKGLTSIEIANNHFKNDSIGAITGAGSKYKAELMKILVPDLRSYMTAAAGSNISIPAEVKDKTDEELYTIDPFTLNRIIRKLVYDLEQDMPA